MKEETWNYEDRNYQLDDDYSYNMPCDDAGFCVGTGCSNWIECKGKSN